MILLVIKRKLQFLKPINQFTGEYDYALQQCRLSSEDRRSQPTAYRVSAASVDYFENECAAPVNGPPGCDFEKYENSDIKRADLVRTAFNVDQCKSLCDATRAFVCRSFTYAEKSAQCWLSSDDALAIGGVKSLEAQTGAIYHQRSHCLDCECTLKPLYYTTNCSKKLRAYNELWIKTSKGLDRGGLYECLTEVIFFTSKR